MAFCDANTFPPISNQTEATKVFNIQRSVLNSSAARDSSGLLTETSLASIYNTLATSGRLVSLDVYNSNLDRDITSGTRENSQMMLNGLGQKEEILMGDIKSEFCFNYVRYKYSLNKLFEAIVATSTGSTLTESQKNTIQGLLDTSKKINTNLNDLVQITNYIAIKRAEEMGTQNQNINALNVSITETFNKIKSNTSMLKNEDAVGELRRRMVEFSQEKNLSANNLLALYGFLNLVSIGLLFYIYRK
jgi:hypothetical protein